MKPKPAQVSSLALQVYCVRLEDGNAGAVRRVLAEDKDNGQKMRGRAMAYAPIVRALLTILDLSSDLVDDAIKDPLL